MTPLYVCLHVPEFPAQTLLRMRPELARLPVVVLAGEAPFETVASVNNTARRLGVRGGMTRVELDCFAGLSILRRSGAEEAGAQAALLEAAGLFTPRIEIPEIAGADWAMVLDLAGSTRLLGTLEQAVERIRQAVRRLRFSVRMAASANFDTAVCLAPAAHGQPATRNQPAAHSQPAALLVPAGREAARLAPLSLSRLPLTPAQAEAFALWGLETLGELAALPETDVVVRLGQAGRRLHLLARGVHPHLMRPVEPVFSLEESLELESPAELLEPLLFVLSPMLGQLIARARNHALALASVTVKLALEGGGEHLRTVKPALPLSDRDLLLKLLHLDLDAHPPPAAVLRIVLSAEPGVRGVMQTGLFAPQLPEPTRLDVTLARIAALVGEDRVGQAVLEDTHRPESFRMKRFLVPGAVAAQAPPASSARPGCVALRRCRPPVAIDVRRESGRLSAFRLAGTLYTVEQACGPWRQSGDWWSGEVWSREEWDVEAAAGDERLLGRLSHDLLRRRWHLEAFYD